MMNYSLLEDCIIEFEYAIAYPFYNPRSDSIKIRFHNKNGMMCFIGYYPARIYNQIKNRDKAHSILEQRINRHYEGNIEYFKNLTDKTKENTESMIITFIDFEMNELIHKSEIKNDLLFLPDSKVWNQELFELADYKGIEKKIEKRLNIEIKITNK